jgi:hypothetical protein
MPETIPWKQYGGSIIVEKSDSSLFDQEFVQSFLKAKLCAEHKLRYNLQDNRYRLYRRGKNRCHRCGIKLNATV